MYKLPDTAHLPKQQYSVVTELDAPIDECFVESTSVEGLEAWGPGVASVVYDHSAAPYPFGPGAWRKVTLKSGFSIIEVLFISDAPKLGGYFIPDFGPVFNHLLKNYQGRINFEAIDANRTRMTWNGYFDSPGWRVLFAPLIRANIRKMIAQMSTGMRDSLAARKRG